MKPKLIILSDLFGFDNSEWIEEYVKLLETNFEIALYDSYKLAEINNNNLSEIEFHNQFINGGIKQAVTNLIKIENNEIHILAFSIGGTIAWKAALESINIKSIYAVSSTRIRYEIKKPSGNIYLLFGENDPFKPKNAWFQKLKLEAEIIKNGLHEIYKNEEVIQKLCKQIITDSININ